MYLLATSRNYLILSLIKIGVFWCVAWSLRISLSTFNLRFVKSWTFTTLDLGSSVNIIMPALNIKSCDFCGLIIDFCSLLYSDARAIACGLNWSCREMISSYNFLCVIFEYPSICHFPAQQSKYKPFKVLTVIV